MRIRKWEVVANGMEVEILKLVYPAVFKSCSDQSGGYVVFQTYPVV